MEYQHYTTLSYLNKVQSNFITMQTAHEVHQTFETELPI